jgi:hypothetical protein
VAKKLWDQNELNEKANSAGAGHSWAYAAAIFARSTGDSAEALRYIEWMSRGCNKPWIFITNVVGAPAIDVDRVSAGQAFSRITSINSVRRAVHSSPMQSDWIRVVGIIFNV